MHKYNTKCCCHHSTPLKPLLYIFLNIRLWKSANFVSFIHSLLPPHSRIYKCEKKLCACEKFLFYNSISWKKEVILFLLFVWMKKWVAAWQISPGGEFIFSLNVAVIWFSMKFSNWDFFWIKYILFTFFPSYIYRIISHMSVIQFVYFVKLTCLAHTLMIHEWRLLIETWNAWLLTLINDNNLLISSFFHFTHSCSNRDTSISNNNNKHHSSNLRCWSSHRDYLCVCKLLWKKWKYKYLKKMAKH